MDLTPEDMKFLEEQTKKLGESLARPLVRIYGAIFCLIGWMTYLHWHVAPAVVAWTLGVLFLLASYKKG